MNQNILSFHSSVIKNINEHLVLNLIKEHEIISSSDLVKITGMRPSTIFNILKELSSKSLVQFLGKGNSTDKGGKKPYIWTLNHQAAYVIGLDVEVGEMTVVVMNFGGDPICKKKIKLEVARNIDELSRSIISVVRNTIIENKIDESKVLGLGIAFAGVVDHYNGVVVMSSVLPQMNFPLLDHLKDELPFPVLIENNANAAAIGAKWNGQAKNKKNYITVLVEIDKNVSGLGIGIVINGQLYRGASFCAGELYPHLPTLRETLATVRSRFEEGEILKNFISSPEEIDMELLVDAVHKGDNIASLVCMMIGGIVGQTIAPAIALLNPDTLIITGIISELEEQVISSVRAAIETRVLSISSAALEIITDKNHQYSVALGAASVVLEDYFRLPIVK